MESTPTIQYLKKPHIKGDSLPFLKKGNESKDVYVNLFEINIKKPLKLYQYPFSTDPEIGEPISRTNITNLLVLNILSLLYLKLINLKIVSKRH